MFEKVFLVFNLLAVSSILGMELSRQLECDAHSVNSVWFQKYNDRNYLPRDTEEIIAGHESEVLSVSWPNQWRWLPAYFIKQGIERIYWSEVIRECIKQEGLDCLEAPRKMLYHIRDKPLEFNDDNYRVVAQAMPEVPGSLVQRDPLTLRQTQQFIHFIKLTHFSDFQWSNVILTKRGTLACIDTERCSFSPQKSLYNLLNQFKRWYTFEADALQYLEKVLEKEKDESC